MCNNFSEVCTHLKNLLTNLLYIMIHEKKSLNEKFILKSNISTDYSKLIIFLFIVLFYEHNL